MTNTELLRLVRARLELAGAGERDRIVAAVLQAIEVAPAGAVTVRITNAIRSHWDTADKVPPISADWRGSTTLLLSRDDAVALAQFCRRAIPRTSGPMSQAYRALLRQIETALRPVNR